MKSIVWLASYPKSGNTWLRLFLANYILGRDTPVSINEIERYSTGDSLAELYRRIAGAKLDIGDDRGVLGIRARLLKSIASNGADVNLVKTHNKNAVMLGHRLIPPELTRRAIYVVRDPLDTLVSYADHYGVDPETAARQMADPATCTLPEPSNVRQFLGSWSENVASWTRKAKFPVTSIRYEDMLERPAETFGKVLIDIGAPVDPARLERAIRFSSFDEAKKQERREGFIERSPSSKAFFRAGRSGTGREQLSPEVIDAVCRAHGPMMKRYGYME